MTTPNHITNQILNADCRDVLGRLPPDSIDFALTDPPYFVNYRDRSGRSILNDSDPASVLGAFSDLYRALKPDTVCVSFYGWTQADAFFTAWRRAGFRPVGHIVWHKSYASHRAYLNARHEQACVLAKGRPARPLFPLDDVQPWTYSGNRFHPTEKSVEILKPLIRAFSRPGDLVIDPFAGSGSTLAAAALIGRRYLGVELDPRHADAARRRLTGVEELIRRTAA